MRVSRRESRDFIEGSLYVRDRRGPQTPYQIMSTKVSSSYTILFSKLVFSSMKICQQWHSTTTRFG